MNEREGMNTPSGPIIQRSEGVVETPTYSMLFAEESPVHKELESSERNEPTLTKKYTVKFIVENSEFRLCIFTVQEFTSINNHGFCRLKAQNCPHFVPVKFEPSPSKNNFELYTAFFAKDIRKRESSKIFILLPIYYDKICQINRSIRTQSKRIIERDDSYLIIQFDLSFSFMKIESLLSDENTWQASLVLPDEENLKLFFRKSLIVQHAEQKMYLKFHIIFQGYIRFSILHPNEIKDPRIYLKNSKFIRGVPTNNDKKSDGQSSSDKEIDTGS